MLYFEALALEWLPAAETTFKIVTWLEKNNITKLHYITFVYYCPDRVYNRPTPLSLDSILRPFLAVHIKL